ncbi:hypothetical protein N0V90_002763 [Kalmusia sp. IMI 367209]|nr:hypothetical protein N0V90_002763 [Kalmusia sp. IMI 367209]
MASTAPSQPRPETASKERFFRYFQHEVIALQDQMARLANTPAMGGERADAIDHCLAGISRLSSEVKDAASYIPAYDQRTYGDAIKALSEKLQKTRNELSGGQKKFTFKTKKNVSAISIGEAAEMAQNRKLLGPGTSGWNSSEASSAVGSMFAPTPLELLSPGEETRELEFFAQDKSLAGAENGAAQNGASGVEVRGLTVANHDGSHIVLPADASHSGSSGTVSQCTA